MPPTALINTLESLRRRVRLLSVLYGVGIVVAAAAGLLLATVLLDYLLNLLPIPRIILMVAALFCLCRVLARWVIRPAMSRLGLSDIAGRLEHAFPDFKDRLRSTVDFVTKGIPGSEVMKTKVVAEATELAGRFDLNSAIETKPVWESFAAGGGAIIVLIILGALAGQSYLSPALSRLINPFGQHPWPKRVQIEMVADLPQRIPVGRPVDVRIRLIKGDRASREARLYYQYGDGRTETEIMTRGADGIYSASPDAWLDAGASRGLMKVWIESGDDSTPPKTIAIVQRLGITSAQLLVQPPSYVNEPATPVAIDTTPATVTYGSTLTMTVMFNKELDPAHPASVSIGEQGGKLPEIAWDAPSGSTVVGRWIARDSTAFLIHALDRDGFANADSADFQVIVRPDQMPSVQITRPARNEECTPQAVIPLRAIAEDDYAIKSLKLLVYRLGEKPVLLGSFDLISDSRPANGVGWNRVESAGDRRRWQLDFPWDLSKLAAHPALKPGDVLEYHLEAQDNFALEGKYHDPVSSGKYRITIMSQEQFTSLMNDLVGQVREEIKGIRNTQRSLKAETEDLHHQTQSQPQFSRADRQQAQELVGRQATAASQAKQSAEKLDALLQRMDENRSTAQDLKNVAANVRDDLNQVAEHPMKDAAAQVDDARNQKSDPQTNPAKQKEQTDARNAQLAAAENNQQDAADRLDEMVSRMGDAGGLSQAIQQLHDILNQQRQISQTSNDIGIKNLGKTPDQMQPQDRKAQQANADAQAALADKTSKTLDQMQQTADQLSKTDPSSSQAMQQAAQTGQQQNVASQMQSSAESQRQNQQASAQQSQAQVEIGLQMMIHQLEEAQQRKLAALARQLADLQEQMTNLLRQQGGLNYDNLALRGGAALKTVDPKVIDHLLELAERTKDHLPPTPDLDTQGRLQEQTERNTRGASKSAESLPDGASIVAELNRAADRMGRAITALRDDNSADQQRLAAAYDPPQVEALASLEKSKQLIDDQAAKNNEALNQKKKDTIRAAYQKILDKQKKIDSDTVAIDKAPRSPDGQLGHRDAILLGQLPPRQGVLVDQINKLDNDLASLDSIVYVWANHDIAVSMKSVRQELAKPRTDVVTQAQQTQIEEQIQAMIDSLLVKPKQIPFAMQNGKGGGGGGGGHSGETLPTEAELRLLKRLQEAVNKATVTISQQGNNQDPVLVALGGRQGELRNLLDQLVQKSSHGQAKLGPEPDPKDKLPEEASGENIDDQELTQNLLQGDGSPNPDPAKNDIALAGQRMARSRQRLALDHDPGKVTQEVQKRILQNLDALIDMARKQEAESKNPSGQQPQQGAQPSDAQANGQSPNNSAKGQQQARSAGHTPASVSVNGHDVDTSGTPTTDITQSLKEWGALSPRQRAAVIEAASEKPVQKFKEYIDEYYQALGNRQAQ
ncbi:MAG TPA: hypothetical protein VHX86_05690 [Tepidisphaeraceae bacterium]|jgi:hypothetical protein|nr:hypothetical protein [Tepidisphaeraceae bacterium]